jgi:hypothetical protein
VGLTGHAAAAGVQPPRLALPAPATAAAGRSGGGADSPAATPSPAAAGQRGAAAAAAAALAAGGDGAAVVDQRYLLPTSLIWSSLTLEEALQVRPVDF